MKKDKSEKEKRHTNAVLNPNSNPFGKPLRDLVNNDFLVPYFVTSCLNFLREYGMNVEGIFRISAQSQKLNKLKSQWEKGFLLLFRSITHCFFEGEITRFEPKEDPHTVACLLKVDIWKMETFN